MAKIPSHVALAFERLRKRALAIRDSVARERALRAITQEEDDYMGHEVAAPDSKVYANRQAGE